jgi:CHAT domain-containing protein
MSTSVLMQKTYELIKEGRGKAEALIEAQRWLKNPAKRQEHIDMVHKTANIDWVGTTMPDSAIPDFSAPYYWAGYICSGAP